MLAELARSASTYDDVIETLEREGVEKFEASWIELLDGVEKSLTRPRRAADDAPSNERRRPK